MSKATVQHEGSAANFSGESAPTLAFRYSGREIRSQNGQISLTDMWRASGTDESKKPAQWLRGDIANEFIEFVRENSQGANSHLEIVRVIRGGDQPGTWAHWQVAFAYAKYLSPAFHVWCNEVVRAHMQQRQAPPQYPAGAPWEGNARGELRDDPSRVESMRRLIGAVAKVHNRHWQAIHGDLLRTYQVRSYKRVPVGLAPAVEQRLHDMIDGRVSLPGGTRVIYALQADTRQIKMDFAKLAN